MRETIPAKRSVVEMASTDPRFEECARNAWSSPGSATVHKGEPSATENAKLWFHLSPDEDARLDIVLADSLARYKRLSESEDRLSEHIATMSELMRDKGLDTSLTEVYHSRGDAPEVPTSTMQRQELTSSDGNGPLRFRGSPSFDLG
jgi:hypothetical protein